MAAAQQGLVRPLSRAPRFPRGQRSVYVANHGSMAAFLVSKQVRDATEHVANDIAALAKALTPVGDGDNGVHLRDQYKVVRNGGVQAVGKFGSVRVRVTITNPSAYAASHEFGGKNNPKSRMLGRAGAFFGDLKEGPPRA